MKSETLAKILSKHGQGGTEGDTTTIPEDQSITLYASIGGEALMVADVRTVEMDDQIVLATTAKGDLFAIASEDVRAMRIGPQTTKKKTGLIRH